MAPIITHGTLLLLVKFYHFLADNLPFRSQINILDFSLIKFLLFRELPISIFRCKKGEVSRLECIKMHLTSPSLHQERLWLFCHVTVSSDGYCQASC